MNKNMTIKECIDRVDKLYPNQYSEEIKVDWLSRADYEIFNDVFLKHYPPMPPRPIEEIKAESSANPLDQDVRKFFPPIKPELKAYSVENMNVPLLVKYPYDELYIFYLMMKIDEANGDSAQYNNHAIQYGSYYTNFASHFHAEHKPVNTARYHMWRH